MSKAAQAKPVLLTFKNPFARVDPWTRETYRLIADFKVDFDRQRGRGASAHIAENFLLMASDALLERFADDAHWNRLDVFQLFERFPDFARMPGFQEGMITSLGAFYCYLGNIGRVSPEMHGRMRQLSLDCLVVGLANALEQHRALTHSCGETKPALRVALRSE